jgi:hypothetical protein
LDIFGERLRLQLSPFYYYCQLDDGFFAVALEAPVGSATLDLKKIEPRAFSIVSTNSRFLSPKFYFIHPLDKSAFFRSFFWQFNCFLLAILFVKLINIHRSRGDTR